MIILEAPELGGRMSLQLHHPPEGVHHGSFLTVPEPGEPLGKGASGGLPVDVLHRPRVVNLFRQVEEQVEGTQVKLYTGWIKV